MMLKVQYWNCGSGILRKLDFIKEQVRENNLDLFFISEAEIKSNSNIECLNMPDYKVLVAPTLRSRNKTRIICIVRNQFDLVELPGSEFDDAIAVNAQGTIVIGIYRGFKTFENESEKTNFERLLNTLKGVKKEKELFIIGDFNIDMEKTNSRYHNELQDWCDEQGLVISHVGGY